MDRIEQHQPQQGGRIEDLAEQQQQPAPAAELDAEVKGGIIVQGGISPYSIAGMCDGSVRPAGGSYLPAVQYPGGVN